MMKIKWTDKKRQIPKIGIVEYGQQLVVSKDIAKAFIRQGQAVEVSDKKDTKKSKEKD